MKKSIPFIKLNQQTNFYILTPQAIQFLQDNYQQSFFIVAFIGTSKSGRSYLINKLNFNNYTSLISPNAYSCTKGVFFLPELIQSSNKIKFLVLDFEGFQGLNKSKDSQLLTLSLCISDLIVFNTYKNSNTRNLFDKLSNFQNNSQSRPKLIYITRDQSTYSQKFTYNQNQLSQQLLNYSEYLGSYGLIRPTSPEQDVQYICDCKLESRFKDGISIMRKKIYQIFEQMEYKKCKQVIPELIINTIEKINEKKMKQMVFPTFSNLQLLNCQKRDIFSPKFGKKLNIDKQKILPFFSIHSQCYTQQHNQIILKDNIDLFNKITSTNTNRTFRSQNDFDSKTSISNTQIHPFNLQYQNIKLINIDLTQEILKKSNSFTRNQIPISKNCYIYIPENILTFELNKTMIKQNSIKNPKIQYTMIMSLFGIIWNFTRNNQEYEALYEYFKYQVKTNLNQVKTVNKLMSIFIENQKVRNSKPFQRFIKLNKHLDNFIEYVK